MGIIIDFLRERKKAPSLSLSVLSRTFLFEQTSHNYSFCLTSRSPTKVRNSFKSILHIFCFALSIRCTNLKVFSPYILFRGLQQTTCLQHRLQPNLQMQFPRCSRLLGTEPPPPPLLLSQLKSKFTAILICSPVVKFYLTSADVIPNYD